MKNLSLRKLQKLKSNSNAKLKITIVVLSKKNKNEYQHSISSTSNTQFYKYSKIWGGQYLNEVRSQKKIGFAIFWLKAKSNTHASWN